MEDQYPVGPVSKRVTRLKLVPPLEKPKLFILLWKLTKDMGIACQQFGLSNTLLEEYLYVQFCFYAHICPNPPKGVQKLLFLNTNCMSESSNHISYLTLQIMVSASSLLPSGNLEHRQILELLNLNPNLRQDPKVSHLQFKARLIVLGQELGLFLEIFIHFVLEEIQS